MKKLSFILFVGIILLSSCNDLEWDGNIPQTFKLISVQFTPTDEQLQEILSEPDIIIFENKSDTTKTFVLSRNEYQKKTSFFYTPDNAYPQNSNIQEIFTTVPEIDAQPKIIGLSVLKYPLIFDQLQSQMDTIASSAVTLSVPAHSISTYTSQSVGYKIKAIYYLTLENEVSGEVLILTGKWEGTQEVSKRATFKEEQTGN